MSRPTLESMARDAALEQNPELRAYHYSYWQRGCDDGYAGRDFNPPSQMGSYYPANWGYGKGYDYGAEKRLREQFRHE